MNRDKEKPFSEIRATVTKKAQENIDLTKASELINGNKMSREETISFMLENFKGKK